MVTFPSMPAEIKSMIIQSFLSTLVKQLIDNRYDVSGRLKTRLELIYEARVLVMSFTFTSKELLEQVRYEATRILSCCSHMNKAHKYIPADHEEETAVLKETAAYLDCVSFKLRERDAECRCGDFYRHLNLDTNLEDRPIMTHKWHTLRLRAEAGKSTRDLMQDVQRLFLENSLSEIEFIEVIKHQAKEELEDELRGSLGEEIWGPMIAELEKMKEERDVVTKYEVYDEDEKHDPEEMVVKDKMDEEVVLEEASLEVE
jgi:hypothetical protein